MNILVDGQTLETEEINRGIGVYFKNVLSNMIKHTSGTVWYISVSNRDVLNHLEQGVEERLNPIVDDMFAPSFDYSRAEVFTDRLNATIFEYNIDCMWVPNPLMVNVLFPSKKIKCPLFATVYDLIPYIMPIKDWSDAVTNEYMRRIEYLKDTHMLCISSATERDVRKIIGTDVSSSVTLAAVDTKLFYRKRDVQNTSDNVIIVFTGGFDYRKNIDGAIMALAEAKKKMPSKDLKLYIVCKHTEKEKKMVEEQLHQLNLVGQVVLTGFISDKALAELYHTADVFFFPSLYEGFGLPLLEAMLGGAYILSADNSSLPEVCGDYAIFCDAQNVDDMAEKLVVAIQNSLSESLFDKHKRQQYACEFSWKKTAMFSYGALKKSVSVAQKKRKRIAMVTPWPKQQTGIANYVYRLTPFLSKYFDIDIFVDKTLDLNCELLPNIYGGRYLIEDLDNRHDDYDEIIFQLGNSEKFHSEIYRMFKKYNGVAEIHDFILCAFFFHSYYLKGEIETYHGAWLDGYGIYGDAMFQDVIENNRTQKEMQFPMCHSISNIAKKTIVHNEWSYHRLGTGVKKYLIPLASFEKDVLSQNIAHYSKCSVQNKIDYKCDEILIGCFGWINENRRPYVLLNSAIKLIELGYKVKVVYFGECNISDFEKDIEVLNMQKYIKVTGFLENNEYQVAMDMCDIIVNLRYPSMGESSATLCEAFKAGKPVIISAINQYLEYPNEVCWKLPVGDYEGSILIEMLMHLIERKDVRNQLGMNAKQYAEEMLNGDGIAQLYLNVLCKEKKNEADSNSNTMVWR